MNHGFVVGGAACRTHENLVFDYEPFGEVTLGFDKTVITYGSVTFHDNHVTYAGPVADDGVRTDNGIIADETVITDGATGFDNGCGFDNGVFSNPYGRIYVHDTTPFFYLNSLGKVRVPL